jgi:hypothetical protein
VSALQERVFPVHSEFAAVFTLYDSMVKHALYIKLEYSLDVLKQALYLINLSNYELTGKCHRQFTPILKDFYEVRGRHPRA